MSKKLWLFFVGTFLLSPWGPLAGRRMPTPHTGSRLGMPCQPYWSFGRTVSHWRLIRNLVKLNIDYPYNERQLLISLSCWRWFLIDWFLHFQRRTISLPTLFWTLLQLAFSLSWPPPTRYIWLSDSRSLMGTDLTLVPRIKQLKSPTLWLR